MQRFLQRTALLFLFFFSNNCLFQCCPQFAVHYFTDRVCHIHFTRHFSAAIHSHFGLTRIEGKTYFWSIFFSIILFQFPEVPCAFFPTAQSFCQRRHHTAPNFGGKFRQILLSVVVLPETHAWRACTCCS